MPYIEIPEIGGRLLGVHRAFIGLTLFRYMDLKITFIPKYENPKHILNFR